MEKLDKEQLKAVIDSFREYVVKSDVIFLDALKEKGLIEEDKTEDERSKCLKWLSDKDIDIKFDCEGVSSIELNGDTYIKK